MVAYGTSLETGISVFSLSLASRSPKTLLTSSLRDTRPAILQPLPSSKLSRIYNVDIFCVSNHAARRRRHASPLCPLCHWNPPRLDRGGCRRGRGTHSHDYLVILVGRPADFFVFL